jgi:diguanylate cyclase (GGDEF)-like protein
MSPSSNARQRILIVDDAMTNIVSLEEVLRGDYEVLYATGSEQGLEMCKALQPDLVLLDVVMPGIDGFEVCARLKSDPETRDIPIVFVTARSDIADETRGLDAGAIDFITKPFSPPIVRARVRNHLELARQRDLLSMHAFVDGLTGVANRRKFEEALDAEWRRCARQDTPLGLIMADVDLFKLYNDNYGHQAGDACLKGVAGALAQNLNRGGDLIARYGGEEFVCLLPETDLEGVRATAARLVAAVSELAIPHLKSSVARNVTVSLGGTAAIPHPDLMAPDLVRSADNLLFRAKKEGRNRSLVEAFAAAQAKAQT